MFIEKGVQLSAVYGDGVDPEQSDDGELLHAMFKEKFFQFRKPVSGFTSAIGRVTSNGFAITHYFKRQAEVAIPMYVNAEPPYITGPKRVQYLGCDPGIRNIDCIAGYGYNHKDGNSNGVPWVRTLSAFEKLHKGWYRQALCAPNPGVVLSRDGNAALNIRSCVACGIDQCG